MLVSFSSPFFLPVPAPFGYHTFTDLPHSWDLHTGSRVWLSLSSELATALLFAPDCCDPPF